MPGDKEKGSGNSPIRTSGPPALVPERDVCLPNTTVGLPEGLAGAGTQVCLKHEQVSFRKLLRC